MKIKMKNLILGIKNQMPLKRIFKNFIITGNGWGMFSINSHINQSTNKEKISYSSFESANKSAIKMSEKKGVHFSVYKCIYCDGWHIGKNRANKVEWLIKNKINKD